MQQDVTLSPETTEMEGIDMSEIKKIERNFIAKAMPWVFCILGAAFYFYEYLLRVAPSVMTTDLMMSYHISAAALGNLTAFYYYIYSPMQIPVGVLMDRYGPRNLLTLAGLSCAVGTYLFASSYSLFVAEIGRFMVGFGSAFAFVGVLKLATIWLPPERFAMISGTTMALGQVGAMTGAIALTSLVTSEGWKLASYITAVIGVVLTLFLYFIIRDRRAGKAEHKSIAEGGEMTLKAVIYGMFQLLRNPQIWLNGLIGCLIYLPTSVFAELWGIPYLKVAYNFSGLHAASVISMIFLGWATGGPIVGWTSDRIRQRRLPITVGSVVAAVLLSMVFFLPNFPAKLLGPTFFVFGVFSSTQVIAFPIGREISPRKLAGTALALTNMLVMMGGMLFQPLVGVLLDMNWSGKIVHGVHVYAVADYQSALAVLPFGLVLAVVLSFFLRETHCKVFEG